MSVDEILAELPRLKPHELETVELKLRELLPQNPPVKTVWESLRELAGSVEGLPPDFAEQHDHYLYGVPKQ